MFMFSRRFACALVAASAVAVTAPGGSARSVTDVMSLGAEHGDLIQIQANGVDEVLALNALIALIQNN